VVSSGRAARNAGMSPVATAVTTVAATANSRTPPSTCTVVRRGKTDDAARLSNAIAPYAATTPSAPPPRASTTLSVKSCLTTRPRPAPRADRMASSRPRTPARASGRLATLTHAIMRTSATARTSARDGGDRRDRRVQLLVRPLRVGHIVGQDADHRGHAAAQGQRLPEDVRVSAEPTLPQAVRKHRDVRPRPFFVRREQPPHERLFAER